MSSTTTTANDGGTDEERELRNGKNARYLSNTGYRASGRGCNKPGGDCDGVLWFDSHELVCSVCGYVIDMAEKRRRSSVRSESVGEVWGDFWSGRDEYHVSGINKCPGGFLDPYEWVTSDEADSPIKSIDPSKFYR